MEFLDNFSQQLSPLTLGVAIVAFVLSFLFLKLVLSNDAEAAVDYTVSIPEQCKPGWKGEELEDPQIKIPGSSAIQCYCPANGRLLGRVNPTTADGIDRAIAKAKEAQVEWAKTNFSQRRKVLQTMLKYILDNQETIATAACLDSGKTKIDASFGEILVTVEKLKWTILHGEKALRPEKRPTNFLMMYKANEVRYEPLGVVAACVSWNYPFHNIFNPLIPTLFTGSALLLKSSEHTAWSTHYFTSIARSALLANNHSPHLIQPITCWPPTASHLTSHPSIAHLTFIGSRPVAQHVALSAARSLTPTVLELGGKDPALILDCATDLPAIVSILMRGVFQSAGQNCVGIERIIALPSAYDELLRLLPPRIAALRVGSDLDSADPVNVGAHISAAGFDRLECLIRDAVARGARLLVGGSRYSHPECRRGHYFAPTLVVDVTAGMRIAREELFAPVCVVMRAESVDQAVAMANDTEFALGASVFGNDKGDVETVVKGVRAGMVAVNDFAVFYAVGLPFGGVGGSGFGRFGGVEGLRGLCNVKAVSRDRWGGLGVRTKIPKRLDYPIGEGGRGWEMCRGIVEVGYGESLRRRVGGLGRVVRNAF